MVFLFPDFRSNITSLFQGIERHCSIPLIGGASGDNLRFQQCHQFHDGRLLEGACCAVLMSGEFEMATTVSHGSEPIDNPSVVTRARGNVIFEIDGRPALDLASERLGEPITRDNLTTAVTLMGIGHRIHDVAHFLSPFRVSAIHGFDFDARSCMVPTEIAEGAEIQFMRRDPQAVLDSTRAGAAKLRETLDALGATPNLVCQFDCAGRGKVILGDKVLAGIEEGQKVFADDVPWMGSFAFGGDLAARRAQPFPQLHRDPRGFLLTRPGQRAAMVSKDLDRLDAQTLREKLLEAERKYYTNFEVLQEKVTRLEAVQTLSKLLIEQNDPAEALEKLVELSIRLMGVEKATVCRPVDGGFEVGALRGYSRRSSAALRELTLAAADEHISAVVNQSSPVLLELADTELGEALDLCQAILCPIRSDAGHLFGLYVVGFSPKKIGVFRQFESDDVEFFGMITAQVGALLENLGLRDTFRKFVPFEFLELLDRRSIQDIRKADHVSLDMHVMFADLRGFTRFSETMGPEAVFDLLNEYLATMEPEIAAEKGFINQYQGDAIMALFPHDADSALGAAIRMFSALDRLNARRTRRGETALRNGIGINSGRLLLGTIGSDKRLDSNVVGDAANLASRVEGMTRVYGARALVSR